MIRSEAMIVNGKAFLHTWSDAGYYVVRDGVEYAEAIDPASCGRTYAESENRLPDIPAEVALDILTGGGAV